MTSPREKLNDAHSLQASPCNLCPRLCGALRAQGQTGACGADAHMMVARAALHFWEEPPLSGESGSGAVFFSGCPLRCAYCQNAEIAASRIGWPVSAQRLAGICLDLQAQGALNVNFVTPTHYSLQVREAVQQARGLGLHLPIVWNTSGYERPEVVEALTDTVNVYLADYKYADADLAARYSHAPDYPSVALAALDAMVRAVGPLRYDDYRGERRLVGGVIVRHLVLPGAVDASKRALSALWQRYGNTVAYSIMNQYTPVMGEALRNRFPELDRVVSPDEYEQVLDFADDAGLTDYFWQEGPAARESFIPAWDGEGVL